MPTAAPAPSPLGRNAPIQVVMIASATARTSSSASRPAAHTSSRSARRSRNCRWPARRSTARQRGVDGLTAS
eukprot:6825328-Prymnesium_polylepis.1